MDLATGPKHILTPEETALLHELRQQRRARRRQIGLAEAAPTLTPGQRIADWVAAGMGSWRFIISQSLILVVWLILNLTGWVEHWDPYPFILLNLALSFQAAYAAPFIMMSQNRQQSIDREEAASDYRVNIKAELEIELLHEKIDRLRMQEVAELTRTVSELVALLGRDKMEKGAQPEPGRSA